MVAVSPARRQRLLLGFPDRVDPQHNFPKRCCRVAGILAACVAVWKGLQTLRDGSVELPDFYARPAILSTTKGALTQAGESGCMPDQWGPIIEPKQVYDYIAPSKTWLSEQGARSAARWFWLFTPVRWSIRTSHLNVTTLLNTFATMQEPPVALPIWGIEQNLGAKNWEEYKKRQAFWPLVLCIKVGLLLLSNKFWYEYLIARPSKRKQQQGIVVPPGKLWPISHLRHIFLAYHISHNIVLYIITDVGVANGFLNGATGWDWELWSSWLDWLLIVVNVTAIFKYGANRGCNVESSMGEVAMLLLPGVGSDAHLAKDWAFVGVCFQKVHCSSEIDAVLAFFLGVLSIVFIHVPLKAFAYPEDSHAAASFIASHWPIIMATPKIVSYDTQSSRRKLSVEGFKVFAINVGIPQTTVAKELVAFNNELPQAIIELLFGFRFGFSPFISIVLFASCMKVLGIRIARGCFESWILTSSSPEALLQFVKANGNKRWFNGKSALEASLSTPGLTGALVAILALQGTSITQHATMKYARENRSDLKNILHDHLVVQQTSIRRGQVSADFQPYMHGGFINYGTVQEVILEVIHEAKLDGLLPRGG